jgi:hypothetical protein
MKVKKIDKRILNSIIVIIVICINLISIYKPLVDKEQRLLNQAKVISKLEKDKLETNQLEFDRKNLIINIENYFKDISLIKYIKSNNDEDFTCIELSLTGNKNAVVEKLVKIDELSKNIFLDSIKMEQVDENNIDCSLKLNVY